MKRIVVAPILLSATLSAFTASAQPAKTSEDDGGSGGGLEEIIVSAQRRDQQLQKVPLSVTALSSDVLTAKGISTLSDIKPGVIPGFNVIHFVGTEQQLVLNIRGIGVSDPVQGTQELAVPVYFDGVYLGRAQGLGLDLAEPERVEVLRGPQGQLFGRNAMGGAVQVVTKKPTGKFGVSATASYGMFNTQRYVAHVNLPEVAGVSVLFDFLSADHDGYTKNEPRNPSLSAQQDFGIRDDLGWRSAVRWRPSENLTFDYAFDHSRSEYTSSFYALRGSALPVGTHFPESGFPKTSNRSLWQDGWHQKVSGHNLTADYDVNDKVKVKSISAYRTVRDYGANQLGESANAAGILPFASVDQKQVSQELQLLGTFERLTYTVGLYYFHEEVQDIRQPFGSIVGGISVNPFALVGRSLQKVKSDSYAAYTQLTYVPPILSDKLELTAGVRFTDDTKNAQRNENFGAVLPTPLRNRFSTSRWDPAGTVKYSWTDSFNTYVRYATGYRSGGASVRSLSFSAFNAEVMRTWEIGLKSEFWDHRSRLNAAIYRNKVTSRQFSAAEVPLIDPSITNVTNSPDPFITQGVEVEWTLAPTDRLTFGLNYSFAEAKLTPFDNPLTPTIFDLQFFQAQGLPKHSGSVNVDYVIPNILPTGGEVALHLDYQVTSNYNTAGSVIPGINLVNGKTNSLNARIAFREIPMGERGTLQIAGWARNILDADTVQFAFPASNLGSSVGITPPFTAGADLTIRY